jgi:hypothetical protein
MRVNAGAVGCVFGMSWADKIYFKHLPSNQNQYGGYDYSLQPTFGTVDVNGMPLTE